MVNERILLKIQSNVKTNSMRLEEAATKFLNRVRQFDLPKTAHTYKFQLDQFVAHLKNKEVGEITEMDVESFRDYLGTVIKNNGGVYAQSNVNYKITVVKSMLKYYFQTGELKFNPDLIRLKKTVVKTHRHIKLTEYEKILAAYNPEEFYKCGKVLMFRILWETGIRITELCNLDLDKIDLQKRTAYIATEKSRTIDPIFWSKETNDLLIKYLGVRLALNQEKWLFLTQGTGRRRRLTARTAQRWCEEAATLTGVGKFSPHCFRHGKAHYMKMMGAGIDDIATSLRHRSWRSAEKYQKFDNDEKEFMAQKYLPQ